MNDVRGRFLGFMREKNIDQVVRISADSPLIHPEVISNMILSSKNYDKFDIVTNIFPRTFPKGQSVEIISRTALESLDNKILSEYDKEHVTSYFYNNFVDYRIQNVRNAQDLSNLNLCIDLPVDLIKIKNFANSQNIDIFSNELSWEKLSGIINEVGVIV